VFLFISEGVHLFALSEAYRLAKPTGLQGGPGMAYSPATAMPIDVHGREPACMSACEIFGLRTEPSKSVKYHPTINYVEHFALAKIHACQIKGQYTEASGCR